MKVEIGGGTRPLSGYTNLDPAHGEGTWRRRIQDGIPLPDSSATHVRASHVLEHIPAGQERIDLFNEVHRVLKPGGSFQVIVPMVTGTWHAFADPTHVSFWVPESFHYFDGRIVPNAEYGILPWMTLTERLVNEFEGHWSGQPRKD